MGPDVGKREYNSLGDASELKACGSLIPDLEVALSDGTSRRRQLP